MRIAIIGAGASGTITAIQLLQKLTVPAQIYLIEKREEAVCRGTAYSSQLVYEPLNVQAGRMSIFNQLPDSFYDWVKENKQAESDTEITKDSFVSRRWFGEYLCFQFEKAKRETKEVSVEIINACCHQIGFQFSENAYFLQFENAESILADYVVFATGNETPSDIFSEEQQQVLGSRYISNPWHNNPFEGLKPDEDILFLGTGLTTIDHLVSLKKQNHQGAIFCFSRNGYLPLPHAPIQHYTFEPGNDTGGVTFTFATLKRNIQKAAAQNVDWQNVIDAMRPYTSQFWRKLSTEHKKYFLKRLRTYWEIHRHRMPQASGDAIAAMQQSGQLKIGAGTFTRVEVQNNKVLFHYYSKADRQPQYFAVDRIINCTGPSNDYYQTDNTLFKQLLQEGFMKQDDLKLGIATGVRGEIIQRNGVILHNAFAVGPVRKAEEWESTAMREIRTQAENVAISIAAPDENKFDLTADIGL